MEFQRKDDVANKGNYDWTEFYKHFADGLLHFKNNREDLVEKIVRPRPSRCWQDLCRQEIGMLIHGRNRP